MDHEIPMALQLVIYALAFGIIALTGVLIYFVSRLRKQLERVAIAVETFEAELIPLARDSRVAVTHVRELSDRVQRAVGVASDLVLPPVMAFNKTSRIIQTAATTFLQTLWNGHSRTPTVRKIP